MFDSTEGQLNTPDQISALLGGDTRTLARAISLVGDRDPAGRSLLRAVFPYTGKARKIGITGPPGVGKSTLGARIASEYRGQGHGVAILAIDPSSPFTGGAMLGDRMRMQLPGRDPGIYIRSMATGGHLGGLGSATAEVVDLLDAAGFSRILIESVGAGQDEFEILSVADVLVLVLAPGLGDSVQMMKSGLIEAAHVFAINKRDCSGLEAVANDLRTTLELTEPTDRWRTPIALTKASSGDGVDSLTKFIESYLCFQLQGDFAEQKVVERWKTRILSSVREAVQQRVLSNVMRDSLAEYAARVVSKDVNPYGLLQRLVAELTQCTEQPDTM